MSRHVSNLQPTVLSAGLACCMSPAPVDLSSSRWQGAGQLLASSQRRREAACRVCLIDAAGELLEVVRVLHTGRADAVPVRLLGLRSVGSRKGAANGRTPGGRCRVGRVVARGVG